jgi:hypothetical protein
MYINSHYVFDFCNAIMYNVLYVNVSFFYKIYKMYVLSTNMYRSKWLYTGHKPDTMTYNDLASRYIYLGNHKHPTELKWDSQPCSSQPRLAKMLNHFGKIHTFPKLPEFTNHYEMHLF